MAAALRRLALVVVLSIGVTAGGSLLVGVLAGASLDRALTLGFYLTGSFLLLGGFFIGNRGPARRRSGAESEIGPFPLLGERRLRWATLREQDETINTSALLVGLGILLILVGFLVDSRHSVI
ncbi:MAG: hypothetical protein WBB76_04030 [Gaiellaceae bacterium]